MCHQLIIVNKVDLLFQPCHHPCVVFDARPTGSEKIIVRTLKERRRPQKVASLAARANSQDCRGLEGCRQEAVPLMSGKETVTGALSVNHMCQALEEGWLSGLASQNISPPWHSDASVSGTFGRKGALGWGLLISHVSLRRLLGMSKRVLYTVSPWG